MHFPLDAFGHWPHCPPSKTWGACKKKMWFFDLNNMCLFLHLNTILFFMLFFQGVVVLNGIRYAFLRPTRFPLQIPKCPANDPQVPGSSSICVADSEIPCKQITDFQLRSVYYTLSLSSSFTHVHPVSSSLIIIPYHELSPIFVHLLLYDQMIPNDGTCKSIQIQPSKCHSPGSPVSC